MAESKERLEKLVLCFIINTAELVRGQDGTLVSLMTAIPQFFEIAQQVGRGFRIEIVGRTDTFGSESKNHRLSQERTERTLFVSVPE